jgi:hypothetical protein
MVKVYLFFALLVASVNFTFAQTNSRAADNFDMASGVKIATEATTSEVAADELEIHKKLNPVISSIPVLSSQVVSEQMLGAFSTGNADVDSYIVSACLRYNIDPLLIYAQMKQESGFKQKAISHKGASGYMQLMPDTARRFGVKNIFDTKQNIDAGVKYMRFLLNKFDGDMRLALAGYNAGEGSVMKYGNQIPPYRETQNYVAKITAHYNQIKNAALSSTNNELLAKAF